MINRLTTIQIKQNNETTNLSIDELRNLAVIMGLLHNLGDGCRGQNRGRDGRGTATGGPR